jgi:hypothetical protein
MDHQLSLLPTSQEIITSAELLIILWPVRVLLRALEGEFRAERRRVVRLHVKSGHNTRFTRCLQGDCASLQKSRQVSHLEPQPEIQAAEY